MLGELTQQRCCSSPLCPRQAAGSKGDTHRMPPLCQRAQPKFQRAKRSQHWKLWKLARLPPPAPWEGAFPFQQQPATSCSHTADGSGTLCHLVIRNPEGTREVPGLTPHPAPFVPLPATLPSHPLLHHPCSVCLNHSSITPG